MDFVHLSTSQQIGYKPLLREMNACDLTPDHPDYFQAIYNTVRFWCNTPYYMDPDDEPCFSIKYATSKFAIDTLKTAQLVESLRVCMSVMINSDTRRTIYSRVDFDDWFTRVEENAHYWSITWACLFPVVDSDIKKYPLTDDEISRFSNQPWYSDFEKIAVEKSTHAFARLAQSMNIPLIDVISTLSKKATVTALDLASDLTIDVGQE